MNEYPLTVFDDPKPTFIMSTFHALDLHCVYKHELITGDGNPPVPIYFGVTLLCDLFAFQDAKKNSEWVKYVTPDRLIGTTLIATGDQRTCGNYRFELVKQFQPHCNLRGHDISGSMQIRCIEDGKMYDSITEAARIYNCAMSAISNHLNRKPGHKSVKGRTFERVPRQIT